MTASGTSPDTTNSGTTETAKAPGSGLGVTYGSIVMELGYDDDADAAFSEAVEGAAGAPVVADDFDDVVDVVLLWWRDDDGDLTDALVDAIGSLSDGGTVLLATPKPGRTGHVAPEDVADAAPAAGLQITSTINAGSDWTCTRLTAPRATSRTGKNLGQRKADD